MGTCALSYDADIDIGSYEYHLEKWNSRNLLDYMINLKLWGNNNPISAKVTVKNGVVDSSIDPWWPNSDIIWYTVPGIYSLIKDIEKEIYDKRYGNCRYSLKVSYNDFLNYPASIIYEAKGHYYARYTIDVRGLEEGDLEIDIGDWEGHWEAWENQNMLNYRLEVTFSTDDYFASPTSSTALFEIVNGISVNNPNNFIYIKASTVPKIFDLIMAEEKSIKEFHDGQFRASLNVQYNTEYHYPELIRIADHFSTGYSKQWEINLIPAD